MQPGLEQTWMSSQRLVVSQIALLEPIDARADAVPQRRIQRFQPFHKWTPTGGVT